MSTPGSGLLEALGMRPGYLASRAFHVLRARVALRGAEVGSGVGTTGRLEVEVRGTCRIGPRVSFRGGMIPTQLVVHPHASLDIGCETVLNYGVSIEAHDHIRIGARCMLGSMVRICDFDRGRRAPVVVGDDVWIAHGAIVLPGVSIGDGAVVSAGAVVTSTVPAGHLASGNPARLLPLALLLRETQAASGNQLER
jgi:acetyltransferase-like isoleucine patch superfamily enzyme